MAIKKGSGEETPNKNQTPNGQVPLETTPSEKEKALEEKIKKFESLTAQLEERLSSLQAPSNQNLDAQAILKLADAIKGQSQANELDYQSGIREDQIPEDDYLVDPKDWVTFCVPKAGYVLTDDKRKGHVVKLPFNRDAIFFEYITTNRTQNGKHTVTTPLSTYVCKSKAERDWIRNHSYYQSLIFESTTDAASVDSVKAMRTASIMNILRTKDTPSIISQARSLEIQFNGDVEATRMHIAQKMVEIEMDQKMKQIQDRLGATYLEKKIKDGMFH